MKKIVRICATEGCNSPARCRGVCSACYGRHWRAGSRIGSVIRYERSALPGAEHLPPPKNLHPKQTNKGTQHEQRCHSVVVSFARFSFLYRCAVGVDARLKWRREMLEVMEDAKRLGIDEEKLQRKARRVNVDQFGLAEVG